MSRLIDAELKPCPFCGGKPEHRTAGKHSIFCKKCGVEMEHYITGTGSYKRFESYGHVKTAWNRRIEKRGGWTTLQQTCNGYGVMYYYHKECEVSGSEIHKRPFPYCPNCGADMRGET